jgi:hypothetical protein
MADISASATDPLAQAERFVWLTGRVLEQRRFARLFRGAPPDPVVTALMAYGNDDGGFGHALEPDVRGPASQPLPTMTALRLLDELGLCRGQTAERICRWLTSVTNPDGALPTVLPSLRDHPHPPFLRVVDDPPSELLVTGPVVGTLHRNEVWHAWLFRATDYCWQVVESLDRTHPYEAEAAIAFLDGVPDRPRAERAAARLGRIVRERQLVVLEPRRASVVPVPPGYAPGEHHYAYDYARTPDSLARQWFSDAEMARALDTLAAAQEPDGGWPIRWREWAPGTRLEWRPIVTVEALLTLRAHGRDLTRPLAPAP